MGSLREANIDTSGNSNPISYHEIVGRAAKVLPGGVLGRHLYPAVLEHVPISGKGAWIIDHTGREYLDYS